MQEIINTIVTTATPLYIVHETRQFITTIIVIYAIYKIAKIFLQAIEKSTEI